VLWASGMSFVAKLLGNTTVKKKLENRPTFVEVMSEGRVAQFF